MTPTDLIPGAEPFSADGGPHGALVLHGFTGHCHSVKGMARALAAAGFTVECPLLPGHGTKIEDMLDTTWADWSGAAEDALATLRAKLPDGARIVVAGLSMGGALTLWLATRHRDLAGLALVNPVAEPSVELRQAAQAAIDGGMEVFPGIGSDIADPDSHETAYEGTPLRAAVSMIDAVIELQPALASIACPVLLVTSRQDHVVAPSNSDHIAATVSGPVERVTLDRSYHVATLDYDKDLVEERVVDFAVKACG